MASMAARRANPLLTSFPHFLTWRSLGFRTMCSGRLGFASTDHPDPPKLKVLQAFKEEFEIGSHLVTLETGKIARFANGSVVFGMGETKVLSTVTSSSADGSRDFLPLTVDYQEKKFAQGLIPNTFMKREGAPKERELLCGRLIDRPIRPLFPAGFYHEVQVMASVLSSDGNHDPDVMAANATSAALMLSDVPWGGPIGVIRIGRVCGKFIVNPTMDELNLSDLNLVYACTRDKTLMIDVQAREISEKDLEAGLRLAHPEAVKYLEPQIRLAAKAGKQKKEYKLSMISDKTLQKVRNLAEATIESVFTDPKYGKFERGEALDKITQDVRRELEGECDEESLRGIPKAVDKVRKEVVRKRIIAEGLRLDGRCLDEVRPLYCEAGTLPILHGSALFSRGDTQVLCTVTLGAPDDAQRLDSLVGPPKKRFMLHYSFPPFSINEVGKRAGLNRREVGHGTLAEKALLAVLPPEDEFAYVVRVNSEVMASDGSTSMATVCGGSMALMDAGIPLREHVAGVSVGLVSEADPLTGEIKDYRILTDILGLEDHLGDMDFKIAGTQNGITAIQLDIKPAGIPLDIICESLEPARKGRLHILAHMEQEIDAPRNQDDRNSQRLVTLKYSNDDLRSLIGPLGALKRRIEEETGARISVGDGTLTIVAKNSLVMEKVLEKVDFIIGRKIEVGGVYKGVVTSIKEYGAFVEFNGSQNGLLHISELSHDPVSRVSDVVSVGQYLSLMCIGQDVRGNIKLSLKATLSQPGSSSNSVVEGSVPRTKDVPDVRSTVNGQEDQTTVSDKLAVTKSGPYTSSTPSVLIRSAAECDEVEESAKSKSSGTTPKPTTASKLGGKSKTHPPEDDLLDSLFSNSGPFSSSKRSKSSLRNKTKQVVNNLETEKMNANGLFQGLRSTAKSNGVSKLGGKSKTPPPEDDLLDSLFSDSAPFSSSKSSKSSLRNKTKQVVNNLETEIQNAAECDEVEESAKSKSSGTTPKPTTASKLGGQSKTPPPEDDLLDSLFSDSGPFSSSERSKSSLRNKTKQVVNNLETEIRSAAECDEVEESAKSKSSGTTPKPTTASKLGGKSKTPPPEDDLLDSLFSDSGPFSSSKRSKSSLRNKTKQVVNNLETEKMNANSLFQGLRSTAKSNGVSKSGGKLKTALPIADELDSLDSDIGLTSTKSKRSKRRSEKKVKKGVNDKGTEVDASGIEIPLSAQNLKIGVTVSATVYQVRTHGLVLDLGSGIRGMYRFEENGRTDFEVGDELQVECSSFTSKGIPILKASS